MPPNSNEPNRQLADEPRSVAAIYEDGKVADSYLDRRLQFSWQRLLHRAQVAALNSALATYRPNRVLEVAPGPARLAVELAGVSRGVMVENSLEMLTIAADRLQTAGRASKWSVIEGDAFKLSTIVPQAAFEFAYTFRFIRHFREPERRQLYAQLHACLAPRGVLIFDVVNREVRERLEARQAERPATEIAIYDACYAAANFAAEMQENGFEVLSLRPVLRHFAVQSFISYKLDDVVPRLAARVIAALERVPSDTPLEWIAVCRKSEL
jgi:SAM-dependent methyltransferase